MANQFDGLELACSPSHLVPDVEGASFVNQGTHRLVRLI